jgi:hypothetical protein
LFSFLYESDRFDCSQYVDAVLDLCGAIQYLDIDDVIAASKLATCFIILIHDFSQRFESTGNFYLKSSIWIETDIAQLPSNMPRLFACLDETMHWHNR